ncbi:hypothetical protein [Paenibacillus koleovorans]|uniref:hypothetical protein n=1 Tax=Paenibacillus koleovorans TaxID=121608 RepID=UPI000FD703F8|nr:hypothetical protein [Paenibacillus koleovorans]
MSKKKLIISGIIVFVIILIVSLLVAVAVPSKKAHISAEYSITYEVGKNGDVYDYIVYNLLISNESEQALINFDVDITLDEQMNEFTPLQRFLTEPTNLQAFDTQNKNRNKIIYTKKAAINKLSSMKKEQIEKLNSIYPNLKLEMSWFGGSKEVLLNRNNLTNSSVLDLTKVTQ